MLVAFILYFDFALCCGSKFGSKLAGEEAPSKVVLCKSDCRYVCWGGCQRGVRSSTIKSVNNLSTRTPRDTIYDTNTSLSSAKHKFWFIPYWESNPLVHKSGKLPIGLSFFCFFWERPFSHQISTFSRLFLHRRIVDCKIGHCAAVSSTVTYAI